MTCRSAASAHPAWAAYHGEDGFRTFSHMKPVLRQARWNSIGLMNPPYGATFRRLLKILLAPLVR